MPNSSSYAKYPLFQVFSDKRPYAKCTGALVYCPIMLRIEATIKNGISIT